MVQNNFGNDQLVLFRNINNDIHESYSKSSSI